MVWVSKVFAPLALFAGVAVAVALVSGDARAQPPFGKGQFGKGGDDKKKGDDKKGEDRKGEKKVEEKRIVEKKFEDKKGPGPKSDATVDAWVKVLIEKITDPHDTVRDSARGALVGVGPPAIPALQALADGSDPAKAVAARKLIGAIQGGRGPGQPGQFDPRGPGFGTGGMRFPGPMGPGGPPGTGPMGKGPGGPPGMFPKGPGFDRGGRGPDGDRGRGPERGPDRGPERGGRDKKDAVEVAPMPRVATR